MKSRLCTGRGKGIFDMWHFDIYGIQKAIAYFVFLSFWIGYSWKRVSILQNAEWIYLFTKCQHFSSNSHLVSYKFHPFKPQFTSDNIQGKSGTLFCGKATPQRSMSKFRMDIQYFCRMQNCHTFLAIASTKTAESKMSCGILHSASTGKTCVQNIPYLCTLRAFGGHHWKIKYQRKNEGNRNVV